MGGLNDAKVNELKVMINDVYQSVIALLNFIEEHPSATGALKKQIGAQFGKELKMKLMKLVI